MTRDDRPERVPDWLLGGHVRRRVLEHLKDPKGATAREIAEEIDAGEATVFEVFRALKPLDGLEPLSGRGVYRLSNRGVGAAIRRLLTAGASFDEDSVDRPPGRVKNQGL